jgi:hypothetical protein
MTSMTSPPSLARDETVTAVINCDAHVDTTNHTPTTPTRPVQSSQQSGPPAFRGTSVVFAFALFHPFNAFSAPRRTNDIIVPKASEQTGALSPPGMCPVVPVPASAQLPDTITLASRTISPFLQIERRFRSTHMYASFETLVTKKPIPTITTYCSCPIPPKN